MRPDVMTRSPRSPSTQAQSAAARRSDTLSHLGRSHGSSAERWRGRRRRTSAGPGPGAAGACGPRGRRPGPPAPPGPRRLGAPGRRSLPRRLHLLVLAGSQSSVGSRGRACRAPCHGHPRLSLPLFTA